MERIWVPTKEMTDRFGCKFIFANTEAEMVHKARQMLRGSGWKFATTKLIDRPGHRTIMGKVLFTRESESQLTLF